MTLSKQNFEMDVMLRKLENNENLLEQKNPSDVLIEFCNYYKFNIAFEVDNNNATYD